MADDILRIRLRPTIDNLTESSDMDDFDDEDNQSDCLLTEQGLQIRDPISVKPGEVFEIAQGEEGEILGDVEVLYLDEREEEERDFLPAGAYYFNGEVLTKGYVIGHRPEDEEL